MWFYADNGQPYNNADPPYYDMTQQYVRDWWVNSLVTVLSNALAKGIVVNGVFVDGICAYFPPSEVSPARSQEYNNALVSLMDETKAAFHAVYDDLFILG